MPKFFTLESRRKMSLSRKGNNNCLGRVLSNETKEKIRQANLGSNNHNFGKKFTKDHREKISLAHKQLVLKGIHHAWKGGVNKVNNTIRNSFEYRYWRERIFQRDNYTCQDCGVRNGNGKHIDLQADHIKRFADYPELRFDISNGRTLCVDCHKQTETYGVNRKYTQKTCRT